MRRLLLTLLLVCLALPAVAVEACAPPAPPAPDAAMAMHGHHAPAPASDDRDDRGPVQHGCIGCVPPLGLARAATEPMTVRAVFAIEPTASRPLTLYGPTPPPPRFPA